MPPWQRYGIFVVPEGAFFRAGSTWLGWDSTEGRPLDQPRIDGLPMPVEKMTRTPRRYGFHGTIIPPFRLAADQTETALRDAVAAHCTALAPVEIPTLALRRLGGFVALVPVSPCAALNHLAAETLSNLDGFRAPLTKDELARRGKPGLSDRQQALLARWGYPYVMEEFRFHMTLTGRLGASADEVADRLAAHFAPVLPRPFRINDLALVAEDSAGRFHVIQRSPLGGSDN